MSKNGNNGKSVATVKKALPVNLLEQDATGGLESLTNDDLATPRLKILMQLSPELESNEKGVIEINSYKKFNETFFSKFGNNIFFYILLFYISLIFFINRWENK